MKRAENYESQLKAILSLQERFEKALSLAILKYPEVVVYRFHDSIAINGPKEKLDSFLEEIQVVNKDEDS